MNLVLLFRRVQVLLIERGVMASANPAEQQKVQKNSICRERVSACSVSSAHCEVTVIRKFNTFSICAVHNNHNKGLNNQLSSYMICLDWNLALHGFLNASQIQRALRVRRSQKKPKKGPFDNGVQSELCNCLNSEVMKAEFYLLLSRGT